MTKIYTDSIEPASGTTLTIGESGQNTVLPGNDLRANVVQDLGGNAIFTSNGSGVLSGLNSAFGSPIVLIQSQTADDVASLTFSTGITSTYKAILFKCLNMRGTDTYTHLGFHTSTDGGSSYAVLATSGYWHSYVTSAGNSYDPSMDNTTQQYNATGVCYLSESMGDAATETAYAEVCIWNPAGTTYTKGWTSSTTNTNTAGTNFKRGYVGGWFDTTSAINTVKWQYSTGNIIAGTIKLYGIK